MFDKLGMNGLFHTSRLRQRPSILRSLCRVIKFLQVVFRPNQGSAKGTFGMYLFNCSTLNQFGQRLMKLMIVSKPYVVLKLL